MRTNHQLTLTCSLSYIALPPQVTAVIITIYFWLTLQPQLPMCMWLGTGPGIVIGIVTWHVVPGRISGQHHVTDCCCTSNRLVQGISPDACKASFVHQASMMPGVEKKRSWIGTDDVCLRRGAVLQGHRSQISFF